MRWILAVLTVLSSFAYAANEERKTCAELLDIRTFTSKDVLRGPGFQKSYELVLNYAGAEYSLTVLPQDAGNSTTLIQLIRNGLPDNRIERAMRKLVTRYLGATLSEGSVPTARVKGLTSLQIKQRLEQASQLLATAFNRPEFIAGTLSKKSTSLRVQALRKMLTDFSRANGFAREEERFFDIHLSTLHWRFIHDLNAMEKSYFDYGIFDQSLGPVAIDRAESIEKAWADLGIETPGGWQAMHDQMRASFLSMVRNARDVYHSRKSNGIVALSKFSQVLKEYVAKFKSSPDLIEFSQKDLTVDDIPTVLRINEELSLSRGSHQRDGWGYGYYRDALIADKYAQDLRFIAEWNQDGNFNPIGMEVDHETIQNSPRIRVSVIDQTNSSGIGSRYAVASGPSLDGTLDRLQRGNLETEVTEDSAADAMTPIEEEITDPQVVALLHSVGIHSVFEITNFDATSFVDTFHFTREQMELLLNELNAIGVNLHFDGTWDASKMKLRKAHPEYYQYKHVPSNFVQWSAPSTPTYEVWGGSQRKKSVEGPE